MKEENAVTESASGRSEDFNCECSPDPSNLNECMIGNFNNWMMLSTSGAKPTPRFHVTNGLFYFNFLRFLLESSR